MPQPHHPTVNPTAPPTSAENRMLPAVPAPFLDVGGAEGAGRSSEVPDERSVILPLPDSKSDGQPVAATTNEKSGEENECPLQVSAQYQQVQLALNELLVKMNRIESASNRNVGVDGPNRGPATSAMRENTNTSDVPDSARTPVKAVPSKHDTSRKTGHRKANLLSRLGDQPFDYSSLDMPQVATEFFKIVDGNADGMIDADELVEAGEMIQHFREHRHHNGGELCYDYFSETVKQALSVWDKDGDGTVSVLELLDAAHAQKQMKSEMRLLKRLLFAAVIIIFILCGAMFGLALGAAELAKETKAADGGVMVSASTKEPIGTVSVKSAIDLLELADLATPKSVLLSISQLNLESTSGEQFGVTIQDFKRGKTGDVVMYSSSGAKVVISATKAHITYTDGVKYPLRTHDSGGRRLAGSAAPNQAIYSPTASMSAKQACESKELKGLKSCFSRKRAYASQVNVGNIQNWECIAVKDRDDCTRIKKCDWDYITDECFWRCHFLTNQSDCAVKGAAPVPKRSHGCQWGNKSEITQSQCNLDCSSRTAKGYWDCTSSPSCMWTGKTCEIGCSNYVKTECKMVAEQGFCVWQENKDRASFCQQDCRKRPDKETCDPSGKGETCEWDDCKRECTDTTKIAQVDPKWKKVFQLESDCFERGVNSRWYWDYQCTGRHSHCFAENYKTADPVWTNASTDRVGKCDFKDFDLLHCQPDCEALNKLALDPKYAQAEPTFPNSFVKAKHFCGVERASCVWKNDRCEWKKSCDIKWPSQIIKSKPAKVQDEMVALMRMDMCDKQTCVASRSGGGSSPIDLHGTCEDVKVVTMTGRLRRSRCFLKCELRDTQEHCMAPGEGGRIADTYKGMPCGPMKLDGNGMPSNASKAKMQFPQECVSMCRWMSGKCLTACEFRNTEKACDGTCKWNSKGGLWDMGNPNGGVLEYGGLPDVISCTGDPTVPASTVTLAKDAAKTVAKFANFSRGGAGFSGPVSSCILRSSFDQGNAPKPQHNCYSTVQLKLDTRYEKVFVPPKPGAKRKIPDPKTCVASPTKTIIPSRVKITLANTFSYDKDMFNKCPFRSDFKKEMCDGFAQAMSVFLSSDKYVVHKDWVTVRSMDITGTFVIDIQFVVTFPEAYRPSGLMDKILGNPSKNTKGFFQPGSADLKTFMNMFEMYAFQTVLGSSKWKWDIDTSFGNGTMPAPMLASLPAPPANVVRPQGATLTWKVLEGSCTIDSGGCAMSPSYPKQVPHRSRCKIAVTNTGGVDVKKFSTERCSDYLSTGANKAISGSSQPSGGLSRRLTAWSGNAAALQGSELTRGQELTWTSDGGIASAGWRLCPGTTTTTTTTTTTSTVKNCPPLPQGATLKWKVKEGKCIVDCGCATSPNFPNNYPSNDGCKFLVTTSGAIKVEQFSTEASYDVFSVGAPNSGGGSRRLQKWSGQGAGLQGHVVQTGAELFWKADSSAEGTGWKLCPGIPATTTTVTTKACAPPSGPAPKWQVANGPCTVDSKGCAMSPNFPKAYGDSQSCQLQVTGEASISQVQFNTEESYDKLKIDGNPSDACGGKSPSSEPYSGSSVSLDGVYVGSKSVINWEADSSVAADGTIQGYSGFKLCLRPR